MNRTPLISFLRTLAICLCASLALCAQAEIYKTVGPDGRVTYTDVPGGKKITKVDLPTINSQPASQPTPFYRSTEKVQAPVPDYKPTISAPSNGTDILPDQRDLTVQAAIGDNLRKSDNVQLMFNGEAYGQAQKSTSFTIKEIFRGQHQISVAVVDANGRVISSSPPVTVNVMRPIIKRR